MIFEFFINACVLISFISLAYVGFKDRTVNKNSSLSIKVVTGFIAGILGIILMLDSVQVLPHVIIDFRYLPILLTAIYCGSFPAIISTILIGTFRILYFGVTKASIVAVISALVIGIGFCIISSCKVSRKKKWIYSIGFMLAIFFVAMVIVSKKSVLLLEIIMIYFVGNIGVSCIAYMYTEYLCSTLLIYKKLKSDATKDFLTGLNNVRQFDLSFNHVSNLALRKEENLSLLYVDIDFFKKINDTYGHNTGDIVLRGLAELLMDTVRGFDVVSRNGGEEFSVLLLDCSANHAVRIAERLRKKVELHEFCISDKIKIHMTISIGVSSYPSTTNNMEQLLNDADKALYEAKGSGRNKVVLYNDLPGKS